MVPWLKQTYTVLSFAFQLDSVPAQAAITTLKFLRKNMTSYWPSALSSPFSPLLFLLGSSKWTRFVDQDMD
jgi:hypothetical protein